MSLGVLQIRGEIVAEDWGYQTDLEVLDSLLNVDNKFIVDAGCGDGALCRHLASRGARVLGIEPDPKQAELNRKAPVVANVGFEQAGAGKIPVEPNSVDGVIFSYSLHHVYAPDFGKVFDEVSRIIRSTGFLCVVEPVANGSHQHVIELFHDETAVRLAAYIALANYPHKRFSQMREIYYDVDNTFDSFDSYASYYESKSFNNYSAEVRLPEVQRRFEACSNSHGSYTLTQPMRVNYYTQPKL